MNNKNIYNEVKCNHQAAGFWNVDGWRTADQNEEGAVIAVINAITGKCYTIREIDGLAKRVIEEKQAEIKNELPATLAELYHGMSDREKDEFLNLIED